jgi:hypothetical protein
MANPIKAANGVSVPLTCPWKLACQQDRKIRGTLQGTSIHNTQLQLVEGSGIGEQPVVALLIENQLF